MTNQDSKVSQNQYELNYSFDSALEAINQAEKIILTYHINPDADAIGSCLALSEYLFNIGKQAEIISISPTPNNLKFLDSSERIKVYNKECDHDVIKSADLIIFMDFNDINRIGAIQYSIAESKAKKILIDHHLFPTDLAEIYSVDVLASSTCELTWKLLSRAGAQITKSMADALYSGIITDSGAFKYPRTDSELLRIAANLIDAGVDPVYINEKIFNTQSFGSLRLLGKGLNSLETYFDGKLCFLSLEKNDFAESGLTLSDTEGFTTYPMSLEGVKIGILLIDNPFEESEIKISFRSKDNFSVRTIAEEYNGGGHFHASGARVKNKSLAEVKQELIEKFKSILS